MINIKVLNFHALFNFPPSLQRFKQKQNQRETKNAKRRTIHKNAEAKNPNGLRDPFTFGIGSGVCVCVCRPFKSIILDANPRVSPQINI